MSKKYYFTSDFHFYHHNVLKYDNRPFKNVDHMTEVLIENHNSLVKSDDDFYFLGDFSFNTKKTEELIQRLNGNKFFIKGNHDKKKDINIWINNGVHYLGEQTKITINKQDIILNHFAMRVWNRSHHGAFHLYGHSHGSLERTPWGKSMDVFIGNNNYFPYEFNQIKSILDKRDIKCIDHHK